MQGGAGSGGSSGYRQTSPPTWPGALSVRPSRSARVSRCLTEEGCQRVPPRGVRSRMASSWAAICCSVRSGAAEAMLATSRTSRSSPRCWRSAIQQLRLDDSLRHEPAHGAAEPLDGPAAVGATVQNPHDVAPGLLRPHSPHRRQPGIQPGEQAGQMRGVAARPDLADRVRVAGAQPGIAADPAAAARRAAARPWSARR